MWLWWVYNHFGYLASESISRLWGLSSNESWLISKTVCLTEGKNVQYLLPQPPLCLGSRLRMQGPSCRDICKEQSLEGQYTNVGVRTLPSLSCPFFNRFVLKYALVCNSWLFRLMLSSLNFSTIL